MLPDKNNFYSFIKLVYLPGGEVDILAGLHGVEEETETTNEDQAGQSVEKVEAGQDDGRTGDQQQLNVEGHNDNDQQDQQQDHHQAQHKEERSIVEQSGKSVDPELIF